MTLPRSRRVAKPLALVKAGTTGSRSPTATVNSELSEREAACPVRQPHKLATVHDAVQSLRPSRVEF